MVRLDVTTHALRCIDKAGGAFWVSVGASAATLSLFLCSTAPAGLDAYLIGTRLDRLGTGQGPALRARVEAARAAAAAAAARLVQRAAAAGPANGVAGSAVAVAGP